MMKLIQPQEFNYRFPDKVFGHVPGSHNGTALGSGDRFAGFADLFDYPDPRRLDVRASLRNNIADQALSHQERWLVRRYQQRSSITLWLLADLSRSMTVSSVSNERVGRLAHMIAYSAIRLGDRFAMAGFDASWRKDVSIMPTRRHSVPDVAAEKIMTASQPSAPGAEGLVAAAELITSAKAMVFLASDFCCDVDLVDRALRKLAHYTVVPIVWQHDEVDHLPSHAGWTETRDSETGQRHSLWIRPGIRKRWQQQLDEHFEKLTACFMRYRVQPLFVSGEVTPQQLTQYFSAMKKS